MYSEDICPYPRGKHVSGYMGCKATYITLAPCTSPGMRIRYTCLPRGYGLADWCGVDAAQV
eukprot:1189297-Prorocentrum_minimum.AAC.2